MSGNYYIFGSDALYLKKSIDDKIKEAELIVIGEVVTTLPSQWNGPGSNDPKNASPEEISHAHGLFTDSLISINQVLKGEVVKPVVRVRSFSGKTEKVHWKMTVNHLLSLYEIIDGKAISADDEWVLDELIAYIQNLLTPPSIPHRVGGNRNTSILRGIHTDPPLPEETITPMP